MLAEIGVPCVLAGKTREEPSSALGLIENGTVDLVVNIPRDYDVRGRPDGYYIRRQAVEAGVSLLTDLPLARVVVEALRYKSLDSLNVKSWNEYLGVGSSSEK